MQLTGYHGTVWGNIERGEDWEDELVFDNLSTSYSDLGVVFFTEGEEVAKYFSKSRAESNPGVEVIIRGQLTLERPFICELDSSPWVEIDGRDDLHIQNDREELYQYLERKHDGIVIVANYGSDGSDIAVFDPNRSFRAEQVKLRAADGAWTDWLDYEDAKELFTQWQGIKLESEEALSPSVL